MLENLTGRENIALPLALQNVSAKKQAAAVDSIAQTLGINEVLDHYPTELSGGQKQRVAAARALVQKPDILFGDEPTGALDSKSARELLDTMEQLNKEQDVSILLVTHDPFSAVVMPAVFCSLKMGKSVPSWSMVIRVRKPSIRRFLTHSAHFKSKGRRLC